jgi:endonuclease/exonuclease/phosphatase family metal-dependent hydrolase
MTVCVLSWNLKHGRAVPSASHELFDAFADALAGWEWDVALLQEVPPWWPPLLAGRLGAEQRLVLTSRNAALPLRRAVAVRWPDLIKSNGGGANVILVRGAMIRGHHIRRLSVFPERRWVHAVRAGEIWFANLHAAADPAQGQLAAATLRVWAGDRPAVLGGDFNVRAPALEGFRQVAGHGVDHIFAAGLRVVGDATVLARGRLSDHDPIVVTVG